MRCYVLFRPTCPQCALLVCSQHRSRRHVSDIVGRQLFFTFLAICCVGSLAAFQRTWGIGVCESAESLLPCALPVSPRLLAAGLNGFLLFLLLLTWFLSLGLLVPPLVWDRYGKLQLARDFLDQPRNAAILQAAGTVLVAIETIALTVSGESAPGDRPRSHRPY